tara:strand:+ start:8382 stop:8705 length:324 start_codon:yes stop_codon:yes gene_type:complete
MEAFRIAPVEQSTYDGKIFAESYLKKMERQEEGTVQAIAKSLQVGFKQAHREREEEYETLRTSLVQVLKTQKDSAPKVDAAAAALPLLEAIDARLQRLEGTLLGGRT